jgi:hypothetical protein
MNTTLEQKAALITDIRRYTETLEEPIEEPTLPEDVGTMGDSIMLMCEVALWSAFAIQEADDEEEFDEIVQLTRMLNNELRKWVAETYDEFDCNDLSDLTIEWMPIYLECREAGTLESLCLILDAIYEEEEEEEEI